MRRNALLAALAFVAAAASAAQEKKDERADARVRQGEPTPAAASPGSLWPGESGWVDLVSDLRARRVGDIVTIRVVENVRATQSADADTGREASASVGFDALFGLESRVPSSVNLGGLFGGSASSEFQGGGSTSRSGVLTATITARVVEVLPSGNLRVEASRLIQVNGEKERLSLTGVVRPFDVGPTNEVLSTAIADLEIRYGGKGILAENLKPSFLMRILRFLF